MKKSINWKIFSILLVLSLLSILFVLPYVLTVQSEIINKLEIPIGQLLLVQFIQSIILFSVAIFFGLYFTKKVNFKLPLFESILAKRNYKKVLSNILGKSIFWGIVVAISIFAVDYIFTAYEAGISTHQSYAPIWQTLLASFYGGITEEILMRLFLMTFFIWIAMKLFRQTNPSNLVIIVSIVLASVIFGLGHLPITASVTEIDALVIFRAVILNGIGGVVFGWLFWKKGLESAMIAHFTADVFLLTLLPYLISI